jgi:hypothetical protein
LNREKRVEINQLITIELLKAEDLALEWMEVLREYSSELRKRPAPSATVESIEVDELDNNGKDLDLNTMASSQSIKLNIVKPNRVMTICKSGSSIEEWLDFVASFDADAELLGITKIDKSQMLWRQLAEGSEERAFFSYVVDNNRNAGYWDIVKKITSVKVGATDVEEYWDDAINNLEGQKENETVSAFAARYIRVKKFYEQFLKKEVPPVKFRRKLKPQIRDILIGAISIDSFDELFTRALKIEKEISNSVIGIRTGTEKLLGISNKSVEKCQICNKEGHIANVCYKIIPCTICSKIGHGSKFCNQKNNSNRDHYPNNIKNQKHPSYDKKASHILTCSKLEGADMMIIDSGASFHTCKSIEMLANISECRRQAITASGDVIEFTHKGDLELELKNGVCLKLTDVFYSPKMSMNLISVSQIHKRGGSVNLNKCILLGQNNQLISEIETSGGLFILPVKSLNSSNNDVMAQVASLEIWHQRLGHTAFGKIIDMKKKGIIEVDAMSDVPTCTICPKGKLSRNPFKSSNKEYSVGDVIVTDVLSFSGETSFGGAMYAVTFTDWESDFTRAFPIAKKNEVFECLKIFIPWFERHSGVSIKGLRCDNGGEYLNAKLIEYIVDKGITLQLTIPYSPSQNGKAEVLNRHITEMIRSMLETSGLPHGFWAEAMMHAVYIRNRTLKKRTNRIPVEQCFGVEGDLKNIKVFGCHAEYWIADEKRDKLEPKTHTALYLGTDDSLNVSKINITRSGYRLYDLKNMTVIHSRDVKFFEKKFPYKISTVAALHMEYKDIETSEEKEKWIEAINAELENHNRNSTWEIVSYPEGQKLINLKWVLTTKVKADGTYDKHKARLVAKGFTREFGWDYDESFSPTPKLGSIIMLLMIANKNSWSVCQLDVKGAFLHGVLDREVYCRPIQGMNIEPGYVIRLKKALYGLQEAGRQWFETYKKALLSLGFKQAKSELCYFYLPGTEGESLVHIIIYVDDQIITGKNSDISKITKQLEDFFEMTKSEDISSFLGIDFARTENNRLSMSQPGLIQKIIERFNLKDAKISPIPLSTDKCEDISELFESKELFQQIVGSLMYVARSTRPDIMFASSFLSRKLQKPTTKDWIEAKKVVRYLKGTLKYKNMIGSTNEDNKLIVYADSDFAESADRKSTSGCVVLLNDTMISWFSRKQDLTALSTTEAELVALGEAMRELLYWKQVIIEMGINLSEAKLKCDNQGAIKIVNTEGLKGRTKHIGVIIWRLRDLVKEQEIKLEYIPSDTNIADIFTKALGNQKFGTIRDRLVNNVERECETLEGTTS